MIPTFIFQIWLLGLFSVGLVSASAYLAYRWQQRSWSWDPERHQSVFAPDWGANEATMLLIGAILVAAFVLFGASIVKSVLLLAKGRSAQNMDPREDVSPRSTRRLARPDGSELQVQFYGDENGAPIVLSHGWGFDGGEFNYLKRALGDRYCLITWDEPGLGQSSLPKNRDFSLEKMARDLEAVVALVGNRPPVLLGHSIGGMITLTFCRLFAADLQNRVLGLVLTATTPTNPVRTTSGAGFLTAIEKPVLMPLLYLTILFSPLVRLMNWLSYRNGSAHLSTKFSSFAGTETWEQIDFATKFLIKASPAVLARGMLAMIRYDATQSLPGISVPALVVAGDRDSTTKPEAGRIIHSGIPQSELAMLSPAKHLGLLEHHEAYAKMVAGFLKTVETPALAQ